MFSLKIFLHVSVEGKLCSEIYRRYVCFFFLIYLKQYDFGAQASEIMVQLLPFSVLESIGNTRYEMCLGKRDGAGICSPFVRE